MTQISPGEETPGEDCSTKDQVTRMGPGRRCIAGKKKCITVGVQKEIRGKGLQVRGEFHLNPQGWPHECNVELKKTKSKNEKKTKSAQEKSEKSKGNRKNT